MVKIRIFIEDTPQPQTSEANERKILTSLSTFGIIREQLIKHIGEKRVSDFLFHWGWEMGVNDAKKAMAFSHSYDELIKYGPILHIESGHITGATHKCTVVFDEQNRLKSVYGRGEWYESYEAVEHVRRHGLSQTPVCHTLTGYASGYMSTIFGETILAKEYKCIGKGDPVCTWIVRTKREWEERGEQLEHNQPTIIQELRYTYDQLLEQKNVIALLAKFQKKVMEEVSKGSKLQKIADLFYNTIHIPVVIQSLAMQDVIFSGISKEQYKELNEDLKNHSIEQPTVSLWTSITPLKKQIIKTPRQQCIVVPIRVQNKVLGTCTFIFPSDRIISKESYLFLDSFANAVSLVLLNEKTKFETMERVKGHLLEQLIFNTDISIREVISSGIMIGVDLRKPYYIVVFRFKNPSSQSIETEFFTINYLYELIIQFFAKKKYNILLTQHDSSFILLLPNYEVQPDAIKKIMDELNRFILETNLNLDYKIGVSHLGDKIEEASVHYREACIAADMATKKQIVFSEELGIFGILINSQNTANIRTIAKKKLGPLYHTEDEKSLELLKTLYVFLLNGGNLRKTKNDLSLSMSGLRHRLTKIESLLETDLRNPMEAHELLLIIKSIITIEKLSFW